MKNDNSTIKNFSFLTVFSVSEKGIAFVYQAIIAAVLGTGVVTDCYFSASHLFDLIDSTVLGALVVVVINRYANISAEKDEKAGIGFLSSLNSLLSMIMVILAALTFVLAAPVSYIIAPGFDEAARPQLIRCIRILCVIPPIMVLATLAQGLLRHKKCFLIVNSRSLCISFCGMMVILLYSIYKPSNADLLCYGYVAANLLFSVLLFFRSRQFGKIGYARPTFDEDMIKMIALAVPAIISNGIVRISLMIDQIIASMLGEGAISCLSYAQSLYHVVNSLLIVNLCMVMLTDFTNLCVQRDYDGMLKKVRSTVSSILLLLAPVTLLTLVFSREIVSIAYQRGAFNEESADAVSTLLFFYAIGFIPSMLNGLHTNVLHAFGEMKTAMRNSLISFWLNIVISVIASMLVGIPGIAIGTTVSICAVLLIYKRSVSKFLPAYKHVFEAKYLLKLAVGLLACGAVAVLVKVTIDSALISFAIATVLGFTVFFAALYFMKEETTLGYFQAITKQRV